MRLAANPSDSTLRLQLAAGYGVSGEYEKALEVLDEGIRQFPQSSRFLRLKSQTCERAEMWDCVLATQTRLYDVDTTLIGQTSFYNGQFMLSTQANDTTAMLRWATLFLEYEPESMQYLQARALLLTQLGHTDSALTVHQQIAALDPSNLQSVIAVVQAQIEGFTVDSTQPVDTDALAEIEAGLNNLESLGTDNPNIITMVGGEYLKIAQKFGSAQTDWNRVIQYAEAALERDPNGVLDAAANFWLGYGVFSITVPMDAAIMEAQTCSPMIDTYERNLVRARTALEAGRSVSEEAAGQLLDYLNQLSERPAQFRASFCGR
jgi:tetratricopeptide (TPR) repeat protein